MPHHQPVFNLYPLSFENAFRHYWVYPQRWWKVLISLFSPSHLHILFLLGGEKPSFFLSLSVSWYRRICGRSIIARFLTLLLSADLSIYHSIFPSLPLFPLYYLSLHIFLSSSANFYFTPLHNYFNLSFHSASKISLHLFVKIAYEIFSSQELQLLWKFMPLSTKIMIWHFTSFSNNLQMF